MKLSDGEKLILLMLCDLEESLRVRGTIDPRFIREAITTNNTWGIGWA